MTFTAVIFAFIVALILTTLITFIFSDRWALNNAFTTLILLFLAAWAADVWLKPVGPYVWGVAWLPIVGVGALLTAIIYIALKTYTPPVRESEVRRVEVFSLTSWIFWIFSSLLAVAVIIGLII